MAFRGGSCRSSMVLRLRNELTKPLLQTSHKTGPMLHPSTSFVKPSVVGLLQGRQQLGQRDELHEIEDMSADRKIRRRGRYFSISPLAGHAERAAGGALQG